MPVPRLRLCEFGIFEAARGGPSMAISLLQTLGMARCGRTLVPGNGPANAHVRPAAQGALSAMGHSRRFDAQLFGPGLFSFVAACGFGTAAATEGLSRAAASDQVVRL